MKVIIQFFGLIAQMQLAAHSTAVMPRAAGHQPWLIMVLGGTTITRKIDDTYVEVSGAKQPFNRTRISNVPALRDITACNTLLPKVNARTEQSLVTTYVEFMDGGDLVGNRLYATAVHFDQADQSSAWHDRHCASCEIQYQGEPTGARLNIKLTNFANTSTETFEVAPGDLVIISDEPSNGVGGADDFKYFYKLLDNCPSKALPKENAAEPCGAVPVCTPTKLLRKRYRYLLNDPSFVAMFMPPNIECTNSQWP